MYKFEPILKSTIWGGNRITAFKQMASAGQPIGESWELSAVPGELSVVSQGADKGLTIVELIDKYRDRLLGHDNYCRYGNQFPLLVKFIDAEADLSVQVHPDDALAMQRHGTSGKTEMWYVIDATPDTKLCAGFSHRITPAEYRKMVVDGSLEQALHYEAVSAGDVFYLPAGRVHSIGAGCFIAEIQQTSDVTYRIFDYNRRDNQGNLRQLHVEEAEAAIDYRPTKDAKTHYRRKKDCPVQLVSSPYFTTSLYELTEPMECDYTELDSFVIYICTQGAAHLVADGTEMVTIQAGETVLIPASTGTVTILPNPKTSILEVFV